MLIMMAAWFRTRSPKRAKRGAMSPGRARAGDKVGHRRRHGLFAHADVDQWDYLLDLRKQRSLERAGRESRAGGIDGV